MWDICDTYAEHLTGEQTGSPAAAARTVSLDFTLNISPISNCPIRGSGSAPSSCDLLTTLTGLTHLSRCEVMLTCPADVTEQHQHQTSSNFTLPLDSNRQTDSVIGLLWTFRRLKISRRNVVYFMQTTKKTAVATEKWSARSLKQLKSSSSDEATLTVSLCPQSLC